jgi:hypothetical protein
MQLREDAFSRMLLRPESAGCRPIAIAMASYNSISRTKVREMEMSQTGLPATKGIVQSDHAPLFNLLDQDLRRATIVRKIGQFSARELFHEWIDLILDGHLKSGSVL